MSIVQETKFSQVFIIQVDLFPNWARHKASQEQYQETKQGNVKYMDEKDEVFEAGVQMGLLFETDNLLKVRVIYMCINPEQSLENSLHNVPEV